MAAFNTTRATILILLIGEASGVFAGFCPSWFTVASPFFHDQDAKAGNVNRIRAGEVAATVIVMGTGWAVSGGSLGRFPLYASAAISAIFIGVLTFVASAAHFLHNSAVRAAMRSWSQPLPSACSMAQLPQRTTMAVKSAPLSGKLTPLASRSSCPVARMWFIPWINCRMIPAAPSPLSWN